MPWSDLINFWCQFRVIGTFKQFDSKSPPKSVEAGLKFPIYDVSHVLYQRSKILLDMATNLRIPFSHH